jgi:hypothetical protein
MADGIKIDGLEVFADFASNGLRFTFTAGGLQSIAAYVGSDDDIPYATGQDPGEWRAVYRDVSLHGIVQGTGSTAQAIRESFKTRADALLAKMDPTDLHDIVAYPPHFGLATGTNATLTDCRPLSLLGPDPSELAWYEAWEVTLNFRCISSPPEWVEGT